MASCISSTSCPMRIARAELFELTLPLLAPFVISGGAITERRSVVVVLHDDAGHVGYGESPPFQLPFYSEETLASAGDLIARVLLPRVTGREFAGPEAVDETLRGGVRGNWFARAGVETAAWDLEAHARGVGLATLLGERLGVTPAANVPCGVALGIPAGHDAGGLTRSVYAAVRQGYTRVKIKAAPGWDRRAVRTRGRGGLRDPAHRRRERRVRVAARWGGAARARRRGTSLYRATARARRAPRAHGARRLVSHADLPRRNAPRRARGAADRGAQREPHNLEHQGPPDRRTHRGVPRLPDRDGSGRQAVGGDDAGIGHRLPGGLGRGRVAGIRLSVRPGAVGALVRPKRGRDQAFHGSQWPDVGAQSVVRPAARPRPFPCLDCSCTIGAPCTSRLLTIGRVTSISAHACVPSPTSRSAICRRGRDSVSRKPAKTCGASGMSPSRSSISARCGNGSGCTRWAGGSSAISIRCSPASAAHSCCRGRKNRRSARQTGCRA